MLIALMLACGEPAPEAPTSPPPQAQTSPEASPEATPSTEAPSAVVEPTGAGDDGPGPKLPDSAVSLTGTVTGFGDGQVRFVEDGKIVHVATVTAGSFSIQAPKGNGRPVHIAVTGNDGSWAALADPITLGSESVTVTFASTDQPEWAASMSPPPSQKVDPKDAENPPR